MITGRTGAFDYGGAAAVCAMVLQLFPYRKKSNWKRSPAGATYLISRTLPIWRSWWRA
jgi:hypothetical protein